MLFYLVSLSPSFLFVVHRSFLVFSYFASFLSDFVCCFLLFFYPLFLCRFCIIPSSPFLSLLFSLLFFYSCFSCLLFSLFYYFLSSLLSLCCLLSFVFISTFLLLSPSYSLSRCLSFMSAFHYPFPVLLLLIFISILFCFMVLLYSPYFSFSFSFLYSSHLAMLCPTDLFFLSYFLSLSCSLVLLL